MGNATIQSCTLRENGQELSNKGGSILVEFLGYVSRDIYSNSSVDYQSAYYTIINSTL